MESRYYAEYSEVERAHWWFEARRRILGPLIETRLAGDRPLALLEAGMGTGAMGAMLGRYGRLVGLDLSWLALQRAQGKVDRLVRGDLERLPFRDGTFDGVFACDVLEHVEDDVGALHELRRVCRDDGMLFVTVPAFPFLWSQHDEINHHRRRYSRAALRGRLLSTGWGVEKMSYFNTLLFPPIAGIRLLGRRRAASRRSARSDFARRVPRPLGALLEAVFASERHLVSRCNLPFGVSLVAIARA